MSSAEPAAEKTNQIIQLPQLMLPHFFKCKRSCKELSYISRILSSRTLREAFVPRRSVVESKVHAVGVYKAKGQQGWVEIDSDRRVPTDKCVPIVPRIVPP